MIKSCFDTSFDKYFNLGAVQRSGSKNCQLLLAERCALDTSRGCLDFVQPNSQLPGFDLFERPIQQTAEDAYLRNIAQLTYVYQVPNCSIRSDYLDPQSLSSPLIVSWKNQNSSSPCRPILGMTRTQVEKYKAGKDEIMQRLIAARPKFNDILLNIRSTLIAMNQWELLCETEFYNMFTTK